MSPPSKQRRGRVDELLVHVDSRGRISLVRVGLEPDTYWLATRQDDGSIVLSPAPDPRQSRQQ